jgi:hypothetical protein
MLNPIKLMMDNFDKMRLALLFILLLGAAVVFYKVAFFMSVGFPLSLAEDWGLPAVIDVGAMGSAGDIEFTVDASGCGDRAGAVISVYDVPTGAPIQEGACLVGGNPYFYVSSTGKTYGLAVEQSGSGWVKFLIRRPTTVTFQPPPDEPEEEETQTPTLTEPEEDEVPNMAGEGEKDNLLVAFSDTLGDAAQGIDHAIYDTTKATQTVLSTDVSPELKEGAWSMLIVPFFVGIFTAFVVTVLGIGVRR